MSHVESAAYERALARFQAQPRIARGFEALCRRLFKIETASVLLSGSGVTGSLDRLSDLDLEVLVHPGQEVAPIRREVDEAVRALGPMVAHFPANHLGLADLSVYVLAFEGEPLKIDVWTADLGILPALSGAAILHDPSGVVEGRRAQGGPPWAVDYDDLHNKFVGWMWFTTIKLLRGNLFEAVESLDFMRGYSLLPFLLLVAGAPAQGYRLLEERLSRAALDALAKTYPKHHERDEIRRAFWALVDLFRTTQTEAEEHLRRPVGGGDLLRMCEFVRAAERHG